MSISWDKPNKRWRYQFDRYIAGRRHRASRLLPRGWSQAQADAFDRRESARLYDIASGGERSTALIDDAVAHYLRDKRHLKSYTEAAGNLAQIAWAYEGKPLSALHEVAKLVNDTREGVREGKVLSPATVKQRLALLKAACRWAWKKHSICENDPTTRMLMPKVRNERQVYLTRRQMLTLARASDRHDVRVMIRAAFYTGMRIGELERVSVSRGALHLDDSKNDERRSVPLHPRLRTCAKYLPLSTPRSTLDRGWQRAREACNMAHVHLHDIRHSAASEMINADVDLYTVGTVLGHKDPRSTKRYSHLRPDKLAEAVCRIGQKSPHKQTKKATKKATRKAA